MKKTLKMDGDFPLIVSLTSYPPRFHQLHLTLRSLIEQSLVADKIILWINENDIELLPKNVSDLVSDNLEIHSINGPDLKSYKKIIPSLMSFHNSIIVTCDDDVIYYSNWLWDLYINSLRENHSKVICHRAGVVGITKEGKFEEYQKWESVGPYDDVTSMQVFPIGIGGVLYPPGCFHKDVLNIELFLELAPYGDDIWLYFMSTLAGVLKRKISTNFADPPTHVGSQESALWRLNVIHDGNNQMLSGMLSYYKFDLVDFMANNDKSKFLANTHKSFPGSGNYGESRYKSGGNSGAGSYNRLAEFKAQVLNSFIQMNNILTVIEFGHGDGNQLKLATYRKYLGFDVSATAVDRCRILFAHDNSKQFKLADEYEGEKAELTLSLDVVFHLVEDDVFANYMTRLFDASEQFVLIYSSNDESLNLLEKCAHVKHRKFTTWVKKHRPDWCLINVLKNEFPWLENDQENTSFCEFYFYQRVGFASKQEERCLNDALSYSFNQTDIEKVLYDGTSWLAEKTGTIENYDDALNYLKTNNDWRVNQAMQFAKLIGLHDNKYFKVLDAGCGLGVSTIVANMLGIKWFGYDVDRDSVDKGRRLAQAFGFSSVLAESMMLLSEGDKIPFPDEHFHIAVSHQVIEHVPEIYGYLSEVYRVLVKGGLFHICCPEYRYCFEVHYKIPWIPFLRKDLSKLWVKEFGKPEKGLDCFNYTTLQQIIALAQVTGFLVQGSSLCESNAENIIQRQNEIMFSNIPRNYVSEKDIPIIAERCKNMANEFRGASFSILCQKPY